MVESPMITPVILSGGSGTRLWPLSRESYPKQLLPLISERSLLQETAARANSLERFGPPIIVCNKEHRFVVAQQLQCIGQTPKAILLEPTGRNTAPAAAVAAMVMAKIDEDALALLLPADHSIMDKVAFQNAISTATNIAATGALVTFGITPDGPQTGYGYIHRGAPIEDHNGCFEVTEFIEKPERESAELFIANGSYEWNSGMFMFQVGAYLAELEKFEPDVFHNCRSAMEKAKFDLDFIRLAEKPFSACKSISIDYAIMERTDKAAVIPADIGWNDVGTWTALWNDGAKDDSENVLVGDVLSIDTSRSYIRSDGPIVATLGIKDLVVVATGDAVLITDKDRAKDIRTIVDSLKSINRKEATTHPRVYRPWGYYQTLHEGDRFQVKRITVNSGASLSLQLHHQRAEHWIVVNGGANVRRGTENFILNENESTYIPPNTLHRLANSGHAPLILIEVQSGDYLGEDDIVRYEDNYGRE